jgi:peroxiredoxin
MKQHYSGQAADDDAEGGPAIEVSGIIELQLPDKQSKLQTLSQLKGQVVLLDFHTFTMKESPQRILMLRDLYNKYHEKGLEIYQVALDQDEHFWKQMTQHLPWICVRDGSMQSAQSYNVVEVPEFFLIDRNSQLQKRSSQMTDLEAEIKALL